MRKYYRKYIKKIDKDLIYTPPKRSTKNKIILWVSELVLVLSVITLGVFIWRYLSPRISYSNINSQFTTNKTTSKSRNKWVDFNGLKKTNSDIIGWIDFDKEPEIIDYPIVQGKDNSYYLKHTFDKKYSGSASIFADCVNDKNFKDNNTILYGHNMNDKSMFANLRYYIYKDHEKYFKDNKYFYIYAPGPKGSNIRYKYEIFSTYSLEVNKDTFSYVVYSKDNYSKEYSEWVHKLADKSINKSDIDIDDLINNKHAKVVTLSTCTNTSENGRILVHGILVNTKTVY